MNFLYNHPKIKALVSLTHGEGYGRPLQEATMTGLPVIASNWSGHLDFLDTEKSILLGGDLQQVPQSVVWENIIIPQAQWFVVDELKFIRALTYVFEDSKNEVKNKAKALMKINRNKFTLRKMTELLNNIVDGYTKDMPTQVGFNLPKLKKQDSGTKINKTKNVANSIKLPKLKKVTEGASV